MHYLILVLSTVLAACAALPTLNTTEAVTNTTDSNKDMYVINAMVYQIGIITNKTDEEDGNSTLGHQEAVTFFKNNGSGIDLGKLSTPLMTNVTAQSVVGVAPATAQEPTQLSWTAVQNLAGFKNNETKKERKTRHSDEESQPLPKSSVPLKASQQLNSKEELPMKIEKGVAVVPNNAGVKSLSIPPLISFNNNFSDIPVPIPNTSVVHYAKVNTVVQTPE